MGPGHQYSYFWYQNRNISVPSTRTVICTSCDLTPIFLLLLLELLPKQKYFIFILTRTTILLLSGQYCCSCDKNSNFFPNLSLSTRIFCCWYESFEFPLTYFVMGLFGNFGYYVKRTAKYSFIEAPDRGFVCGDNSCLCRLLIYIDNDFHLNLGFK